MSLRPPEPKFQVGDHVTLSKSGRKSEKKVGKQFVVIRIYAVSMRAFEWDMRYDVRRYDKTQVLRGLIEDQLMAPPEYEMIQSTKGVS